jgi:endoplasmic reticulum chaperone BiP
VNGVLHVSATETGSGTAESITITNEKGRLSDADIERMVREAEEAAEEDKMAKERVESRNSLENFIYQVKGAIAEDGKLGEVVSEDERATMEAAIAETRDWLDMNMESDKEDFDEQYKTLESVVQPIMATLYEKAGGAPGGGAGGAGGFPGGFDGADFDFGHDEL